ncbi:hypothetical protein LXL04_028171 [Taraxacum kok-saghyz]
MNNDLEVNIARYERKEPHSVNQKISNRAPPTNTNHTRTFSNVISGEGHMPKDESEEEEGIPDTNKNKAKEGEILEGDNYKDDDVIGVKSSSVPIVESSEQLMHPKSEELAPIDPGACQFGGKLESSPGKNERIMTG